MRHLIREIHRRSIWQVLGIYLAASWGALEVVDFLASNFGLPDWFPALAMSLLVIGLPIVLATAFVQEGVGPREREPEPAQVEAGVPNPPQNVGVELFTWRNAILGGVGALASWGVVAAGWLLLGGGSPRDGAAAGATETDLRSIAVLPFVTVQTDEDSRAFAVGLHDDLLTQLAKIDSLLVISRTSVMQYTGTTKSIPDIANELGVATVLEGGVRRSGDRIRMNVQLIEAGTDRHLWAETYDEELTAVNLFAIQSDLARKIAGALRAQLTPQVEARIQARPTESLDAYAIAMDARYAMETRGNFGEDIEKIIGLFDQAIALDSSFATAWVGRANALLAAENWGRAPAEEVRPATAAAIDRALALDPTLAEAHTAQARLLEFEGRLEEARQAMERALALSPGSALVHGANARLLESLGRFEEAIAESERVIELDPLTVTNRNVLADRLFFAGHYDASIEESLKIIEVSPGGWYPWYNMGWSHAAADRTPEAIEAFERALALTTDRADEVRLGMAYAYARDGQRAAALRNLESIEPTTYDAALVHWELGDHDRAFSTLESVLRAYPIQAARIDRDPTAAGLRADPRYRELMRRLGFD